MDEKKIKGLKRPIGVDSQGHLLDVDVTAAHTMIEKYLDKFAYLPNADIDTPMIGDDGKPCESLFIEDGLHLCAEGYELWTSILKPYLGEPLN